jgi:hypothetical protein
MTLVISNLPCWKARTAGGQSARRHTRARKKVTEKEKIRLIASRTEKCIYSRACSHSYLSLSYVSSPGVSQENMTLEPGTDLLDSLDHIDLVCWPSVICLRYVCNNVMLSRRQRGALSKTNT